MTKPIESLAGADITAFRAAIRDHVIAILAEITAGSDGYNDEAARDAIGAALVAGANITISVNDAGDQITISATGGTAYTDENARDAIGAALVAGANISIVVNDGGDQITISGSAGYTDEQARDAIGAALVEGAGIDIVVDDAGDQITVTVDPSEIEPTNSEMWTGASSAKAVTPKKIFDAAVTQDLTDGATITIDGNAGVNFKVTLAGNRTLANPTNMKTGQSGIIIVTQDGTGNRSLAYGTNWRFPGGAAFGGLLSTAAGAVDTISYYVRSDGTILGAIARDFKA